MPIPAHLAAAMLSRVGWPARVPCLERIANAARRPGGVGRRYATAALLLLSAAGASAEQTIWSFGVGVGGLRAPHYIGAEQAHAYVVPLPYFRYNGRLFKADRSGMRGILHNAGRWSVDVSGSGSLPVPDNDAREGLDDLDLVLEAGPSLQYTLLSDDDSLWRLDLPLRAAASVGDGVAHRGWTSNPRLYWRERFGAWHGTTTLGLLLGDLRYHSYFYDVPRDAATVERPAYRARGGHTAWRASWGMQRRIGEWYLGMFATYYDLAQAANRDSPLVRERRNLAAGFLLAWVFAEG